MNKINIYIDGNNLYRAAKELGFDIDYKKFRGWLRQKYNPENIYWLNRLAPPSVFLVIVYLEIWLEIISAIVFIQQILHLGVATD